MEDYSALNMVVKWALPIFIAILVSTIFIRDRSILNRRVDNRIITIGVISIIMIVLLLGYIISVFYIYH